MSFPVSSIMLAPVSVFLMAVAGSSGAPPDLTGIAAIVTAGIGVVGVLATHFRGRRNSAQKQEVEEAASYVKGFDALIKRLENEINDLRKDHDKEHRKWMREKESLQHTIDTLRLELAKAVADGLDIRGQLAELRGQIKGYLSSEQYEEFQKHLL